LRTHHPPISAVQADISPFIQKQLTADSKSVII
jgi:hypothetical protein